MGKPQSASVTPSPSDVLTAYETLYTGGQIKPRDMIKGAIQFVTGQEIGPNSFLHRRLVDMIKRARERKGITQSAAVAFINETFNSLPDDKRPFEIATHIDLDVMDTRRQYECGILSGQETLRQLTDTFSNFARAACLADRSDVVEKTRGLIDTLLTNHPSITPHFPQHEIHRMKDTSVVRLAEDLVRAFNQEVKGRTFHAIPGGRVYLPQRRVAVGPNGYLMYNLEHDPFEDWAAIPA